MQLQLLLFRTYENISLIISIFCVNNYVYYKADLPSPAPRSYCRV